jgi:hypothetical protein
MHSEGSGSIDDEFFRIPRLIYPVGSQWHGESESHIRALFSSQNSWHKDGKIHVEVEPGVMRLVGMIHPKQIVGAEICGFFGFWETFDHFEQNSAAFSRMENWLRNAGATMLLGPINFNTFHDYRLRLDGDLSQNAFAGEPYNPKHYQKILEDMGFTAKIYYRSQFSELSRREVAVIEQHAKKYAAALRDKGFRFSPVDANLWQSRLGELYQAASGIFGENLGFQQIEFDEFRVFAGQDFYKRLCPLSTIFAFDNEDHIAGVHLALPDYSSLISSIPLDARGDFKFCYERDFSRLSNPGLIVKTIGVLPRYRMNGLLRTMMVHAMHAAVDHYAWVCGATAREDNPSNRGGAPIMTDIRRYALFGKRL